MIPSVVGIWIFHSSAQKSHCCLYIPPAPHSIAPLSGGMPLPLACSIDFFGDWV